MVKWKGIVTALAAVTMILGLNNALALGDPGYKAAMKGDYVNAKAYWQRGREPDEPRALHNIAVAEIFEGRFEDAVRLFKINAEEMNYAPSQVALAHLLEHGAQGKNQSVKPNPSLAESWWKRASAQGYSEYNNEAKTFIRMDTPLPKEQEAAILAPPPDVLKLSDSEVATRLRDGIEAYRQGKYKRAQELLEPAALLGNVNAQYFLGLAWFNDGPGIAWKFAKWFRRAAKQGHPEAQAYYGYCLETGRGTVNDYAMAKSYYEAAAKAGNVSAIFRLGQLYDHGTGVEVDQDKAEALYRVAIKLGHEGAVDALNYMHNRGKASIKESDVPALTLLAIGIAVYISNLDTTPAAPGNPWDERVKRMEKNFNDIQQQATDMYIMQNF